MGDSAPHTGAKPKRPAVDEPDGSHSSKRLLQSNQFSSLPVGVSDPPPPAPSKARRRNTAQQQQQQQQQQQHQRKEKCPPIFVHGSPPTLRVEIRQLIQQGLKCTMKMCHNGTKLLTDGAAHFEKVVQYLKAKGCEYYSHDFPGAKPLKVVLHGLAGEWTPEELQLELQRLGLKAIGVFAINRRDSTRTYRDRLFLIHLERGSISMKDLAAFKVVDHTIVEWVRYRPKSRDVTQCTNCFRFGHGSRHCNMHPRCNRCGDKHVTTECQKLEEADPKCANCGGQHPATAKACSKRTEYIAIRSKATSKSQTPRRVPPPALDDRNFPTMQPPRRSIPVLPPLQPHKRLAAAAATIPDQPPLAAATNQWPSLPPPRYHQRSEPELPLPNETAPLFTPEQLLPIFQQLATSLRSCKTRYDQICTLGMFVIQNAY